MRGGRETGIQKPTGYSEWSASLGLLLKPEENQRWSFSYQITRQDDVPRTDRIVAGKDSLYNYDPQHRELILARFEGFQLIPVWDRINLALSWNHQREGRRIIRGYDTNLVQEYLDDVQTVGFTAEARSLLGKNDLLIYGIENYTDFVKSEGWETDLTLSDRRENSGKFPEDGRHLSMGLFLQDEHLFSPSMKLIGAARLSSFHLSGTPQGPFGNVSLHNTMITGSLQTRFQLGENDYFFAGLSQSFRSPNMEDALATGLSNKGYDVPNPDLDPETSWGLECGLKTEGAVTRDFFYKADATTYVTLIDDLIERTPTSFVGSDSLDGAPVFHNENVGEGLITGLSGTTRLYWNTEWSLQIAGSWTYGKNEKYDTPLTRIPPLRGVLSIRRNLKRGWLEGSLQLTARQDRLSPDDLRDTRIPEGGTPGYTVLHLRSGFLLRSNLKLNAAIENIFDKTYRIHGSGIDMPGRNLLLAVNLHWS